MDKEEIESLLSELASQYEALKGPALAIGICGGAALSVLGLVERTTRDIDLLFPADLPPQFVEAAAILATRYGLPSDWINQGPKVLSDMGLPPGFEGRAEKRVYGRHLVALFASRLDQIFFKLYAAADRGGYHVDDLKLLTPSSEELKSAAKWCFSHDVSPAFRQIMRSMLTELGYDDVARSL